MKKFKRVLPFVLVILFVASIAVTFVNKGFKYSDYENYIRVDLTGNVDMNAFTDKLPNKDGLIEIDRINNVLYYQQIDQSTVSDNIDSARNNFSDVLTTVSTVYPTSSKKDKIISLALIASLITALFVGYSFIIKTRFYKWTLKEYVKYYGFYVLDNVISLGILTGIISALSLIFKINDYILYSYFFLLVFKTLIFWFKLIDAEFANIKTSFVTTFRNDSKKILLITAILIIALAAGLGVKSVLPLALLLAALVISLYTDYFFLTLDLDFNKIRNFKLKGSKEKKVEGKKATPVIVQTPGVKQYVPNPKLKKKNKKK